MFACSSTEYTCACDHYGTVYRTTVQPFATNAPWPNVTRDRLSQTCGKLASSPETVTTLYQNRERMVLARMRSHFIFTTLLHFSYSSTRGGPYAHDTILRTRYCTAHLSLY